MVVAGNDAGTVISRPLDPYLDWTEKELNKFEATLHFMGNQYIDLEEGAAGWLGQSPSRSAEAAWPLWALTFTEYLQPMRPSRSKLVGGSMWKLGGDRFLAVVFSRSPGSNGPRTLTPHLGLSPNNLQSPQLPLLIELAVYDDLNRDRQ